MLGKLNQPTSVHVFVDDTIVSSVNMESHLKGLPKVFDLQCKANLKLKSSICSLGWPYIKLLGYIITPEGISSDPAKVEVIRHVAIPSTPKQVQSFLSMVNYYSQTIPDYGKVVEPLLQLTHKNRVGAFVIQY